MRDPLKSDWIGAEITRYHEETGRSTECSGRIRPVGISLVVRSPSASVDFMTIWSSWRRQNITDLKQMLPIWKSVAAVHIEWQVLRNKLYVVGCIIAVRERFRWSWIYWKMLDSAGIWQGAGSYPVDSTSDGTSDSLSVWLWSSLSSLCALMERSEDDLYWRCWI